MQHLHRPEASRLIVWDGNNIFRRGTKSSNPDIKSWRDANGKRCGGLAYTVRQVLSDVRTYFPTHGVVVFDGKEAKVLKQQRLASYKAHRVASGPDVSTSMTDAEYGQMVETKRVLACLGVPVFHADTKEADDVIGAIAQAHPWGFCLIVSSDKDFLQLLTPTVQQQRLGHKTTLVTHKNITASFGIEAGQVADYLALMGDAVDGIHGLKGVGQETAKALLRRYGSINGLLKAPCKWGELARLHVSELRVNQSLTKLDADALSERVKQSLPERLLFRPFQKDMVEVAKLYGLRQCLYLAESNISLTKNKASLF